MFLFLHYILDIIIITDFKKEIVMKIVMTKATAIVLAASLLFAGCSTWSKAGSGAAIGGGSGAAIGAGLGALLGKSGESAAIGAALGAAIGAGTGAIIGSRMDKKAEELAKIESAQVETVKDVNGLEAIKVTFDSGILFKTNSANLSNNSKEALKSFANEMKDLPDTDITVYGHTDNTGSASVNEKLSLQRANAVSSYLGTCGIAPERMTTEGKSYTMPVADNSTAEGRAQNRRVEIFISANEKMIQDAQQNAL